MKNLFAPLKLLPFLGLILALVTSIPAYATIAQPDSTPTIQYVWANYNLLTDGDMLVYGMYNIPYASEPSTPASSVFSFRLLSSDGSTEHAATLPFVYLSNGYNYGVFSFYLTDNSTWGTQCIIRISENPAMFSSPVYYDGALTVNDYSTETTREGNQDELADKVVTLAHNMETYYPGETFLQPVSGGSVLSSPTGEIYFSGAIPYLQYMAPSIFLLQSYSGDVSSSNWSTALFDTYEERFNSNWVGISTNASAEQFNVTPMMITGLAIILPLCVGAIVVSSRKFQRAESGFVFCSIALMLGAVMGWIPAAIFASITQAEGIYLAYVIFYARG